MVHIRRVKQFIKMTIFRLLPDKLFLQLSYFCNFGKFPNLRHPKTFNEKILWLKLYDFEPIHTTISDKLAVKEYVKSIYGKAYIIPTYAIYESIDEINLSNLPESFIIKSNNESGKNYIVRNKNNFSFKIAKEKLADWDRNYHYIMTRERQYKDVGPKLFSEKLLLDKSDNIPNDNKFHCFHGKVEFVQVDIDRFGDHKESLYSRDWDLLPFTFTPKGKNWPIGKEVEKPSKLDEMITLSESLSKDFKYIRVDLYIIDDKIYFGELTLHPGSGFSIFNPESFDLFYGDLI